MPKTLLHAAADGFMHPISAIVEKVVVVGRIGAAAADKRFHALLETIKVVLAWIEGHRAAAFVGPVFGGIWILDLAWKAPIGVAVGIKPGTPAFRFNPQMIHLGLNQCGRRTGFQSGRDESLSVHLFVPTAMREWTVPPTVATKEAERVRASDRIIGYEGIDVLPAPLTNRVSRDKTSDMRIEKSLGTSGGD